MDTPRRRGPAVRTVVSGQTKDFAIGQTVANGLIAKTNSAGSFELRDDSAGTTHLVMGHLGYFAS